MSSTQRDPALRCDLRNSQEHTRAELTMPKIGPQLLVMITAIGLTMACNSPTSPADSGEARPIRAWRRPRAAVPTRRTNETGGQGPSDCLSRCNAIVSQCCNAGSGCVVNPAGCPGLCAQVTETQLECLEASNCDGPTAQACVPSGPVTDGGNDSGGPACNAIGAACGMTDCCVASSCTCLDGTTSPGFGICDTGYCQGCAGVCNTANGNRCPQLTSGAPCGDARTDGCYTCPADESCSATASSATQVCN